MKFAGELTFQVNDTVNRHNVHIWGLENPDLITARGRKR